MKKFRLAAAVSVAVLTMSAQAMAAPLCTNAAPTALKCQKVTTLANCTLNSCTNSGSIRANCLKSIDIESLLNGKCGINLKTANIVPNFNCDLNLASDNTCTGTDCTGSNCTGSDCTGTGSNCTGTDCTGSNCTVDNSSANSGSTKNTSTKNSSSKNGSTKNTSTKNGSTKNTSTKNTSAKNGSTPNTSTKNGSTTNGSTKNGSTTNTSTNSGSKDTSSSISAYAQEVVNLVNAERAKVGLSALQIDPVVTNAAQVRAKEIQTSFSHTRPDGRSCFTALDEAGAAYRGAGENIALGQKTPEQVMNDWMNSEGHRANILNGNFKYIGVGVDGNAWTQLFTY